MQINEARVCYHGKDRSFNDGYSSTVVVAWVASHAWLERRNTHMTSTDNDQQTQNAIEVCRRKVSRRSMTWPISSVIQKLLTV